MQTYNILLERRASKQLENLSKDTRDRIIEALHTLRNEGFSVKLDLKKLRGYKNQYRLRVGKYRIIFELRPERTIVVYAILPRKTVY